MKPSTIPMMKMVCRMDKSWAILFQTTPYFLLGNGPNGRSLSTTLVHDFSCQKAGFGIECKHLLYRFQMTQWRCNHDFFDDSGNVLKSDLSGEKGGHSDLVGGVQGDGFGASGATRLINQAFVGQTQTREFTHIRGAEIEMPQVHDREAQVGGDAIRIRQR